MEVDTLHVRIVARTLPGKQFTVGRELRARVALALQAQDITVSTSLDTVAPSGAS
jgi:small conductance mechanosensitive channel